MPGDLKTWTSPFQMFPAYFLQPAVRREHNPAKGGPQLPQVQLRERNIGKDYQLAVHFREHGQVEFDQVHVAKQLQITANFSE